MPFKKVSKINENKRKHHEKHNNQEEEKNNNSSLFPKKVYNEMDELQEYWRWKSQKERKYKAIEENIFINKMLPKEN